MIGVCILCQCYYQNRLQICPDCVSLLQNLAKVNQNSVQEFSGLWQRFQCLGLYQTPLDSLLMQGKYQKDTTVLKMLAILFARHLLTIPYERQATIIPIPMSQQRYKARGFNQAAIIAKTVAEQLQMRYAENIVSHTGKSAVQHELSRSQRFTNMRSAFEIIAKVPKKVCVVDDVYTTGATMQAMCRALRMAGCEYIEIWIIAKTL